MDGCERKFSEIKHAEGSWKTKTSSLKNPIARYVLNYLSFKRKGVDTLARKASSTWKVLDCGCGGGAYSKWFIARCPCTVISVDWSFTALKQITIPIQGKLLKVCADIQFLPIKSEYIDALFTIDTLGHIRSQVKALDEMLRVLKGNAPVFFHSECGDYMLRWPDRMLRRKLGYDYIANIDGHITLRMYKELHTLLLQRFHVIDFFSPGGIVGWLIGYPDKYYGAFREARYVSLQYLVAIFATLKRIPGIGLLLRFVNVITNRFELFLGIQGGGSCFAVLKTPSRETAKPDLAGAQDLNTNE